MENAASSNTATEPSGKTAIFSIVCGAHFLNHFQSSMLGVLYPLMMRDLGIGFVAIGAITAVYGFVGNFLQAFYGFIVPYVRRGVILGRRQHSAWHLRRRHRLRLQLPLYNVHPRSRRRRHQSAASGRLDGAGVLFWQSARPRLGVSLHCRQSRQSGRADRRRGAGGSHRLARDLLDRRHSQHTHGHRLSGSARHDQAEPGANPKIEASARWVGTLTSAVSRTKTSC